MALKMNLLRKIILLLFPPLYNVVSKLFFMTYRLEYHGLQYLEGNGEDPEPIVQVCWHYSIFYCLHKLRKKSVLMLSASDDAELLNGFLRKAGHEIFRGSKGKGGLRAIKSMAEVMQQGKSAGIVADGSQGPPRILQAGCILLAGKTGAPIVPVAWSADRYITFKSWDRTVLPMPFSRISFWCGKPYYVPAEIRAQNIETHRLAVEQQLNDLYANAWGCFGKKEH